MRCERGSCNGVVFYIMNTHDFSKQQQEYFKVYNSGYCYRLISGDGSAVQKRAR